jgi:hypothetical protein
VTKASGRNPHGQFEWGRRRRLIFVTLGFNLCAAVGLHAAAFLGMEGTLLNTLVLSNYSLAGAVIGSYVFGAVWDDRNARVYGTPLGEAGLDPIAGEAVTTTVPEDFAG